MRRGGLLGLLAAVLLPAQEEVWRVMIVRTSHSEFVIHSFVGGDDDAADRRFLRADIALLGRVGGYQQATNMNPRCPALGGRQCTPATGTHGR